MGLDMSFYSSIGLEHELLYFRNNYHLHRWITTHTGGSHSGRPVLIDHRDIDALYRQVSDAITAFRSSKIILVKQDDLSHYIPVFESFNTGHSFYFCFHKIDEDNKSQGESVDLVEFNVSIDIVNTLSDMEILLRPMLKLKEIFYVADW